MTGHFPMKHKYTYMRAFFDLSIDTVIIQDEGVEQVSAKVDVIDEKVYKMLKLDRSFLPTLNIMPTAAVPGLEHSAPEYPSTLDWEKVQIFRLRQKKSCGLLLRRRSQVGGPGGVLLDVGVLVVEGPLRRPETGRGRGL